MSKPPCPICDDTGWVCETHPDKPWGGLSERADACHCGGAGDPCPVCNAGPGEPDITRTGIKIDIDKDGWRH